jgi:hypothetical protein
MSAFPDRLKLTLNVSVGGQTFTIPAGSIDAVELDAKAWGVHGKVRFFVSSEAVEDALFSPLTTRDRIDVRLSLVPRPLEDPEDASDRALVFEGVVTEREIVETVSRGVEGQPMLRRRYELSFSDPLSTFWSEHKPFELFASACMKDAISRSAPAGVEFVYELPRLEKKQDVLCVPLLGDKAPSFLDFMASYLDENAAVLEQLGPSPSYRLGSDKKPIKKTTSLEPHEVGALSIVPSEPRRHAARVLNPFVESGKREDIANRVGVGSVRRDELAHEVVPTMFDQRVAQETKRQRPGEHAIRVRFRRCPDRIPRPGAGVALSDGFSAANFPSGKAYRVYDLRLRAERAEDETAELLDESARFSIDLVLEAELASDPTPRLPPFRRVEGGVFVEARVLSASGGDDDRTWFSGENESAGTWQVRCDVPLFNVTVVVPFEPGSLPGHFFFPPYKGQRVLLRLERDRARIARYLDWAANARTPLDAQGNRIAFGYGEKNGTTVDHAYADNAPALTITRTLAGDTELVTLKPETIFMQVEEKAVSSAPTPKYDVSAKVASAKAKLVGEVEASVGSVTGTFEASASGVSTAISDAGAEVEAALSDAEAKLTEKLGAVRAELSQMEETLSDAPSRIADAVTAAKAEILGALED